MAEELGSWLVRHGALTPPMLEEAQQQQIIYGGGLDTAVLELGLLSEEALLTALGALAGLPVARREDLLTGDTTKLKVIPAKLSQKYGMVPFHLSGRTLAVALIAVPEPSLLEDIGFMLSLHLVPHVALEVRVHEAMQRLYGTQIPARSMTVLAQLAANQPADPGLDAWVAQEPAKRLLSVRPPVTVTMDLGPAEETADANWRVVRPGDGLAAAMASHGPEFALHPAQAAAVLVPGGLDPSRGPQDAPAVEEFAPPAPLSGAFGRTPDFSSPPGGFPRPPTIAEFPAVQVPTPLPPAPIDEVVPLLPPPPEDAPAPQLSSLPPLSMPPPEAPADEIPYPPPDSTSQLDALAEDMDPEMGARLLRRARRPHWNLAAARVQLAEALHRDDVVEVLLRYAHQGLEYAAVLVLQSGRFMGWDSIGAGQRPRSLSHVSIQPGAGTALEVVARTGSSFLGPLKPDDPLPGAVGRPAPRVALLVPFFVQGRMVGVLYGERGPRGIPAATAAALQALTPDLGRAMERLIRARKSLPRTLAPATPVAEAPPPVLESVPAVLDMAPLEGEVPPSEPPAALVTTAEDFAEVGASLADAAEPGLDSTPPSEVEVLQPVLPEAVPPVAHFQALPHLLSTALADVTPMEPVDLISDSVKFESHELAALAGPPPDPQAPLAFPEPDTTASPVPVGWVTGIAPEPTWSDLAASPLPPAEEAAAVESVVEPLPPEQAPEAPAALPALTPPPLPSLEAFTASADLLPLPPEASLPPLPPAADLAQDAQEPTAPPPAVTAESRLDSAPPADWTGWDSRQTPEVLPPATWDAPEDLPTLSAPFPEPARPPPLPPLSVPPEPVTADAVVSAEPLELQEIVPDEFTEPAVEAVVLPTPPPLPKRRAVLDPAVARQELQDVLSKAEYGGSDQLVQCAAALMSRPEDPEAQELVRRASSGRDEDLAAREDAVSQRARTLPEVLRAFPGMLHVDVTADSTPRPAAAEASPLCGVLQRIGPAACALAVAAGTERPEPETRCVALLLALETPLPGVAALVAERLFDPELPVQTLAAEVLDTLRRGKDARGAAGRAALATVRAALLSPVPARQVAAVRAAGRIPDPSFFPLLVELVESPTPDVATAAQQALRDATHQDLGADTKRWREWVASAGR